MKKTMGIILLAALVVGNQARAQGVNLNVRFSDFITFYVSSIDVGTGASDVEMFTMELTSIGDNPVPVIIKFSIRIDSAPMGLSYDQEFLSVSTDPFDLDGTLRVSNTELNIETDELHYADGRTVPIKIEDIETIDFDELEALQSQIIQTGRLPDGNYKFAISITDPADNELAYWERVVVSAHPVSLELISPGGQLEDTLNTIENTFTPFFQWESDLCAVCSYRIRVARFNRDVHSGVEDAIEDQTVLPMDQALGFQEVGNVTSFQYPASDVIDLEPGLVYAWQVMKILPTTIGDEEILSPIYAFKILDPTAATATVEVTSSEEVAQSPVLQFLQAVYGEEEFQAVFSVDGDLAGFVPNDVISLNGASIDLSSLNSLNTALGQGEITILSVEVQ